MQPELVPYIDFFDNYAEALLVTNERNEAVYVNKAFSQLTGFGLDELKAIFLPGILTGNKDAEIDKGLSPKSFEISFPKKGGAFIWTTVSASNIALLNQTSGTAYTLFNPLALMQTGVMKESEERFNQLADSFPGLIWMADPDNRCIFLNRAWLTFTGQIAAGKNDNWLIGLHPDDAEAIIGLKQISHTKKNYSCEFRLLRHDGVYRHVFAIISPRLLPDGTYIGNMGSCLDITEMKEAQMELVQVTKDLKRTKDELEQFAYVTSHDLQEPLRIITGYIQLLQKNLDKGDVALSREFMAFVLEGVSRMQQLITDLLQFSRVNRRGDPFAPVDLNEVVRIANAHLSKLIQQNAAIITVETLPVVNGDTFQLIRLFQNLIENAVKFKSAGLKPEVKISVEEQEKFYRIAVKDNGIGIEDKFHNRIFAIFQRLHTRSDYEGTGIGLAVCRKIVERHGGEIGVESEPGKGSIFYFTIKK